ncbi:methylenetetrahydrofolate reductase [NAD(P)H] [Leptospira biflexa]|uniref:Methylenetetrahydrofolate reductase n=1 Tax=Leptospira biflexa serovar Patoc (strain Patoc 1 / ATCC 23582 / Paris) TaxID=456481 RepID=B0SQU3_LEPBP|nr:methylenetetrahydrofolate reductase [NAD(P)H] [Leptospira biflexa]ABZ95631.1 5,10-methylenetetrahydrofolate reductase [Leptospira biflexa serovar Patoc strain 'Patoc 1 (Ames)']ABZ99340.1 5,10-methylenetetrahydrofolate reductase [Leptospira biflexa serovar Patoc strain 'Patoc 1 (Paris)']TGM37309.1 methylenetetrahydrofolate reductase [NAD(P)H] [Leptospira biflexa]TGM40646.1 methylenetetrahydrofolate reductase [NAD(P)H] [Leptospira biflexa]TGM46849.1 methylenetetrahydrofolate reductase [NAD(P)
MHISEILGKKQTTISFEFFPPKNEEASEDLFRNIQELSQMNPAYVSVTYGAGGSTRHLTHDLVVKLQNETGLTIVSHLTCVGSTKEEIGDILKRYDKSGIHNIMALRGDPPKGQQDFQQTENGFAYAGELVGFIKKEFPKMGIGVAGFPEGHPSTPNRLKEIEYLKWKVDQGADYICTQMFFDNNQFYDFVERCEIAGIKVPIIAGIMPVTSRKGMARMAELSLGTNFPAKLLKSLSRAEDDVYAENVGIHWATEQVRDLLDHKIAGIHMYTLNKSKATRKIYESLGVRNFDRIV